MFDVGFWELVLLAIIALIVLGPERLPEAARTLGRWIGRARSYANGLSRELDNHAELRELRDEINRARQEVSDIGERVRTDARRALDDVESTAHVARDEVVAAHQEAVEAVEGNSDDSDDERSAYGVDASDPYVDEYLSKIPEEPPGYYAEDYELEEDDAADTAEELAEPAAGAHAVDADAAPAAADAEVLKDASTQTRKLADQDQRDANG